jgi:hypothetical protein
MPHLLGETGIYTIIKNSKKTVAFFHFIIPYFEVNNISCILLEGAK